MIIRTTETAKGRSESDALGCLQIPYDALYGIHTARALKNFPVAHRPVNRLLVHAYGMVKLAAVRINHDLTAWDQATFSAIEQACLELADGKLDAHILVDALQGGAGTSTNMNVNEVIANRALQILGRPLGDYKTVDPFDDINRHQSTNDTFPTAVRIAAIASLRKLECSVVALMEAFQAKEKQFADIVKVGRTQMRDAVLTTLGREMSAYADAFARDRWRIYKCEERLRVINLGGTAIGSGLGAPRQYIFKVTEELRRITGFGLARSENLTDCTQNADLFTEVSGILKALSVNLIKVADDLRFLSSGPSAGIGELELPPVQAGSSIMPGKVNPVIPEAVIQAAIESQSADLSITSAAGRGNLELNAFMPLIADALLREINLLTAACAILTEKCVKGLTANREKCREQVMNSTAAITALVEAIGYERAKQVEETANTKGISIRDAAASLGILTPESFDELTTPEHVTRLGSPKTERP